MWKESIAKIPALRDISNFLKRTARPTLIPMQKSVGCGLEALATSRQVASFGIGPRYITIKRLRAMETVELYRFAIPSLKAQ
jgi:hypothetical protein